MEIALGGAGPVELAVQLARLIDTEVLILGPGNEVVAHSDGSGNPRPRDPADSTQFADALSAPIVFGSTYVGHLYVFPAAGTRSPFFPGLVPTCAKIMALAASREMAVASVDGQFRAEFLERLLLNRLDRHEIDQRCQALEWEVGFPAVILSLSPATLDTTPQLERTEDALDWSLRARGLHAPHAIIAGTIVAIVGSSGDNDPLRPPPPRRPGRWSPDRPPGTGSPGSPRPSEALPISSRGWDQAQKAIQVVRKVEGIGPIGVFDDLGIYRLLSEIDPRHLGDFAQAVLGDLAQLRRGAWPNSGAP